MVTDFGISISQKRKTVENNLRKESHQEWLEHVQPVCRNLSHPRDGKDVYIGSTWKDVIYTGTDGSQHTSTIRIVYEIVERSIVMGSGTAFQDYLLSEH